MEPGQSVVCIQSSAVSDAGASFVKLKKTYLISGKVLVFSFLGFFK